VIEMHYWRERARNAEAELTEARAQIQQLTDRIDRARRELSAESELLE
jgi:hypothetical protein